MCMMSVLGLGLGLGLSLSLGCEVPGDAEADAGCTAWKRVLIILYSVLCSKVYGFVISC